MQAVADWGNTQKPRELGEMHKSGIQQQGGHPSLAECSPHAFSSPQPWFVDEAQVPAEESQREDRCLSGNSPAQMDGTTQAGQRRTLWV